MSDESNKKYGLPPGVQVIQVGPNGPADLNRVLREIRGLALQNAIESTLLRLHTALWILAEREPDKTIHLSEDEIARFKARFDQDDPTEAPRVVLQSGPDATSVVIIQAPIDLKASGLCVGGRAESHSDSAPTAPAVQGPLAVTYKVH